MAEHPYLFFSPPRTERPRPGPRGGGKIQKPTAAQQRERLDQKFEQIARSFLDLQASVHGIEVEQVIVLETIAKSVENVAAAAARIPGLEWLSEQEMSDVQPGDGFVDVDRPDKKLGQRLYALFSNQRGMEQLLSLWRDWLAAPAQRVPRGFGPFKQLFIHLKDIRRWGVKDRLAETGVLDYWEKDLELRSEVILSEVELWPRQEATRRAQSYRELQGLVEQSGGRCLAEAAVPEIFYHGVLIELPAAVVRSTIDQVLAQKTTVLLRCEQVMFFRAAGQLRFRAPGSVPPISLREQLQNKPPLPQGLPLAALLDGLPLTQHACLVGRIQVDDPDDVARHYQPAYQQHGTAMASLLIHGDLGKPENPISRPLYIRPIYQPFLDWNENLRYEGTPPTCLLVDLFHRAIKRIKEGEGGQAAIAPSVQVINLSFGDSYRPFDRNLSPLARLLDWLSYKYNVLFLVSAGNQQDEFDVAIEPQQWRALGRTERASYTLRALQTGRALRRPFSPAEAINVVTIGSIHADSFGVVEETDLLLDVLGGQRLPSPFSTVAQGFKRAVKPEILFPGGRQFHRIAVSENGSTHFEPARTAPAGMLAAAPGQRPLELDRLEPSHGTSNATVLGTRAAHFIFDRLADLRQMPEDPVLEERFIPVLLKTLLTHGASWGTAAEQVEAAFQDLESRDLSRLKAQLLGYGEVLLYRCLFSTDQRVVIVGWNEIRGGEAHVYQLPLPPSLSANRIRRRLTLSLGWLTPVNPGHKDYRRASLWVHVPEDVLGISKKDLDEPSSKRGTLQHRVLEGERAAVFLEGDILSLTVNCKEDGGTVHTAVSYALAVTLEIAESVNVNLYSEVATRIKPVVPIEPRV